MCDVTGFVEERCNRNEKKAKKWFWVNGLFMDMSMADVFGVIEDTVVVGKGIDEAVEMLEAENRRFEFLGKFDLIDAGRYWLDGVLKQCLVDDEKVVVAG